jgi:hypothetical protein
MLDEGRELGAKLLGILRGEVDLVLVTIEPELHGLMCDPAVEVVDEPGDCFLGGRPFVIGSSNRFAYAAPGVSDLRCNGPGALVRCGCNDTAGEGDREGVEGQPPADA